jgi:uracil-DNA glycosylase family 4
VDGKERLRRYLEQRRDTGERELVLDGMTVDDVMRIVGARPVAGAGSSGPASPAVPATHPQTHPQPRPKEPPPVKAEMRPPAEPELPGAASGDWRAVLAAADRDVGIPRMAEPAPVQPPPLRPPAVPPVAPPAGAPFIAAGAAGAEATGAAPSAGALWPAGIAVGEASRELFGGPLSASRTLDDLAGVIAKCTNCSLYATATNPVPGEGSPAAQLVCVGEAPGATEDATGRPFVGQAGKLLDKILAAIELGREDVFICNVLKHRPPGNRNPLPAEVAACSPYLVRQLELIRPRAILAFGTFAAQTLLQTPLTIGKLRGSVHRYYGVPLIVTYHPAALLRNPAWKRPTWEDVQYARRILDGTGL